MAPIKIINFALFVCVCVCVCVCVWVVGFSASSFFEDTRSRRITNAQLRQWSTQTPLSYFSSLLRLYLLCWTVCRHVTCSDVWWQELCFLSYLEGAGQSQWPLAGNNGWRLFAFFCMKKMITSCIVLHYLMYYIVLHYVNVIYCSCLHRIIREKTILKCSK